MTRLQTGISDLDDLLGGGLLPGTLTVVMGATGIGKTQLGVSFASQGRRQEGEPGIIFDLTARGDSQNHREYAARLCDWHFNEQTVDGRVVADQIWDRTAARRDYLHLFQHSGRRVTASDMDSDPVA